MHFLTTSVLSLCVTATLAAPLRSSRRSIMSGAQKPLGDTMNSAQEPLGDTMDRVYVDIPLASAEICQGEIGAPIRSLKIAHSLEVDVDATGVIRIEIDAESLKTTKKDPKCRKAFKKRKQEADEDIIPGFGPEDKLAVFRKEETGLWSIRCAPSIIEDEGEVVENIAEPTAEDSIPEVIPEVPEEVPTEEPAETKEITEETTEVTTEVTTKVTTKVTTEVRTKKTTEGTTEETSEQTIEETSEEISEGESNEASSFEKRSIDTEGEEDDDKKGRRGVAVNEFDIEIL